MLPLRLKFLGTIGYISTTHFLSYRFHELERKNYRPHESPPPTKVFPPAFFVPISKTRSS